MTRKFGGKIAIVTGGASGIGKELCREMGKMGAIVVLADIELEKAQQAAAAITDAGGEAKAVQVDVSDAVAVHEMVADSIDLHGRLDYLFNNAGVGIVGEVRDFSLDDWHSVIEVNLAGVINGTTAAYPAMVEQGFGHIVNTSSMGGLFSFPIGVPYAAAKHAVVGLSTSLRAEGAGLGVKVSVACPGFVRTPIWQTAPVVNADREEVLAKVPFRLMDASRAARAILRGVERNRAIITFPFHARILWILNRLSPSILALFSQKTVGDFRSVRKGSQ